MAILVVDNLSPFTSDILVGLHNLCITYVYRKFSEVSHRDLRNSTSVILSGRQKNNKEINSINSAIIRECYQSGTPLLGICYGAEIIALTLGGSIRKLTSHIHGSVAITPSKPNPLTNRKKSISVYESHAYCIARLPPNFETLASSQYCEYEIFSEAEHKFYGTQFHPEKSGCDGLDLLRNFAEV